MNATTLARPQLRAPAETADCHIHIYGAEGDYPVVPANRFPSPHATVEQYRAVMDRLNIARAVIVQPAAFGTDNRCTLDALVELGNIARAVAVVTPETSRSEIARMNELGVRGARFMLLPGSVMNWDMLEPVTRIIADFGWHIQFQFDGRNIADHLDAIRNLPCEAVIDHNGKFLEPVAPEHPAMRTLIELLETGRVWVKTSAPYETSRSGPPLYSDVGSIARALIAAAPERVVWATNWPHGAEKKKPDDATLLDVLLDWVPDPATRQKILVENPKRLYGF